MQLSTLLTTLNYQLLGNDKLLDTEIKAIAYHTKQADHHHLFVALRGMTSDGHIYCEKAYQQGVRTFVVEHELPLPADCLQVIVANSRIALSHLSSTFFGHPSKQMTIVGVTGTKGKTTVTNYIKHVLEDHAITTGVIGTNGVFFNGKWIKTNNTTPESYELHKLMRNMLDEGVKVVAIEASSGGFMMHRVDDIEFDIGVYTNLSHDHVGDKEHPTFEHYLQCKAQLFKRCRTGLVNSDDPYHQQIIANASCEIMTYSIDQNSDYMATDIVYSTDLAMLDSTFNCTYHGHNIAFSIPSPGQFSIYNALACLAVCHQLGLEMTQIAHSLKVAHVDGRVEVIASHNGGTIVLDYAHNGQSLTSILTTLKGYKPRRLICLFGSVGGRSELRRKELGDVAAAFCDIAIITSDNPDFEEPQNILDDIAKSFVNSSCQTILEVDRDRAIQIAVELILPEDVLLIAGKGHEKYQIIRGEKVYFNDKESALSAISKSKS